MSLHFAKEVRVSPEVKSVRDLITEVQKPGFCGKCGGCVSFCSADTLGALKVDQKGMPVFADEEKCLRCGICYMICPNTNELDEELKKKLGWKSPIGLVRDCTSAKTTDRCCTGLQEHQPLLRDTGACHYARRYHLERWLPFR